MNVLEIANRFPSQEVCLFHIERARWKGKPRCPFCNSRKVGRKAENDLLGRWNCYKCTSSFKTTSGTIFQGTRIPLQKWFAAIAILLNAKKSVSSCQLARDLQLNQKTAWFLSMRIRQAMKADRRFLAGIVESDETYIGGNRRRKNKRERSDKIGGPKGHSGRGTDKQVILGAVERGGEVRAEPAARVTARLINAFLRRNVDPRSVLHTDQWPGYNEVRDFMRHESVDHSKQYVDRERDIHTNTIEGFWALVKRAILGQHHHYTVEHAGMYIDEAAYKYNIRHSESPFEDFMQRACGVV